MTEVGSPTESGINTLGFRSSTVYLLGQLVLRSDNTQLIKEYSLESLAVSGTIGYKKLPSLMRL